MGDFVVTLPVLAALREARCSASRIESPASCPPRRTRVEILGYPSIAELALAGGLADRVRSVESPALAGFFVGGARLDPEFVCYFSQFDLIVSYLHDPEQTFQSNVARCSTARFLVGPHRPDEAQLPRVSATESLLRPLETIGIVKADPEPKLRLPELRDGSSDFSRGKWLALHPGSGSQSKNWPEGKWSQLLELLCARTGWNFLLVGGEAEGNRVTQLAARLPAQRVVLAQNLSLVEVAQRIACCAGFIGHDTGISHLAAALGLPGVVLWGPSVEAIWRPFSPRFRVLRNDKGIGAISVAAVLGGIEGWR